MSVRSSFSDRGYVRNNSCGSILRVLRDRAKRSKVDNPSNHRSYYLSGKTFKEAFKEGNKNVVISCIIESPMLLFKDTS
jgi:hypothetical protein